MAQVLKEKMVLNHRFCSFTTTKKLVNEAANDSARVSGQDHKKLPALGTNQIAGFREFRPLASSEKNKLRYLIFLRGNMSHPFWALAAVNQRFTCNLVHRKERLAS